jgi:hypothetical protein
LGDAFGYRDGPRSSSTTEKRDELAPSHLPQSGQRMVAGFGRTSTNINEFNEITAVILAECYKSHRKATAVHVGRIAQILGVSPLTPSGWTFQDVCVHTISWLTVEDFIGDATIAAAGECP